MVGSLALALVGLSCVNPPSPIAQVPRKPADNRAPVEPAQLAVSVLEAHDRVRGKAGLSPFRLNPILGATARAHARDMASRRKMSHRGGDGSSPFERMRRNGYVFLTAAENVAYGFDDVESVMDGWLRSPGHRRNILGKFTEIGVGRANDSNGVSYWCVTFGTPDAR